MSIIKRSAATIRTDPCIEPITLIYQFFIHSDKSRKEEIKRCLKFNVLNTNISKIILLNERIYNEKELGISSSKIEQINIGKRLRFSDVFNIVDDKKIQGYVITANADIFYNDTLRNIYSTGLHQKKMMYAQLRFEYKNKNLLKCKLFGPRSDSQDAWIFHSKYNIEKKQRALFNINYGIGGCDQKVTYLLNLIGYELRNAPYLIKCFHYHTSEIRDYTNKPVIPRPHMFLIPYLNPRQDTEKHPLDIWSKVCGYDFNGYSNKETSFLIDIDIKNMREHIKNSLENNKCFSIPLCKPNNSSILYYYHELGKASQNNDKYKSNQCVNLLQESLQYFKNNKISLDNSKLVHVFTSKYAEIFYKSTASFHYSPCDYVSMQDFPVISYGKILDIARKGKGCIINRNILNIGLSIGKDMWYNYVNNKNILIISQYADLIEQQINKKVDFYKTPIFKECKFSYYKTPQSKDGDFINTINNYVHLLNQRLNDIDIVFIGETEYDFFLIDFLQSSKKSAIAVGSYLKLWFGLYTFDDMALNKDIFKVYMSKDWLKIPDNFNEANTEKVTLEI